MQQLLNGENNKNQNKFWLYDWIDTFDINKPEQAKDLLKDARIRKGLQHRAAEVPFTTQKIPSQPEVNSTIDLRFA